MQPWLKWILVLPAAIGAYVGVQLLVILGSLILGTGELITQFVGAVLCPIAFVSAGSRVAPLYRLLTSVCLTVLVAIYSAVVTTWAFFGKVPYTKSDLTWFIVCGVAGIVACIFQCHGFYLEERKNLTEYQCFFDLEKP